MMLENNNSDCCIYPKDDIKSQMRQNFGVNYNEQILFIRDTSFGIREIKDWF